MINKSVYQSKEYKEALIKNGAKIIEISNDFFATEKEISLFVFKKKIIESRGTPGIEDLNKFKEISKNYFYGSIASTVTIKDESMFKDYKKVSNHTILINLKKSKEELWNKLEKKSIRWGVKTAMKNDLVFKECDTKEIEIFYRLYEKTTREGGFIGESLEFIKSILESNISRLFIVKENEDIVAGGLILIDEDNKYSILDLTSASEEGMRLQAMPFLYWNIIEYSKNLGLDYFDMGGYDLEAKKWEKTYNINKYKERFGGEVVVQAIFSSNSWYPFIRKLLRKAKFLKRIYNKH